MSSPGRLVVVVPTYNEAENLSALMDGISKHAPSATVVIVDDNSPDGTSEKAAEYANAYLIRRPSKQGLGTAYIEGFRAALGLGAEYIVQMDADLSHQPKYIPELMSMLKYHDVVVGSRYVKGGGHDGNWGIHRRAISAIGNYGIRMATGLPYADVTSGFKAYHASVLARIMDHEFECSGFGFQAEVAQRCRRLWLDVSEHPIVFNERNSGKSKMDLGIAVEAACKLWRLK